MRTLYVVVLSLAAGLTLASMPLGAGQSQAAPQDWIQLFNGKTLDGWTPKFRGSPLGENYLDTFGVANGALRVSYDKYTQFDDRFGHLFYKDAFSYYRLVAEYRFVGDQAPGGPDWAVRNNGFMLHSQAPSTMGIGQDFPISVEVQLLGGLASGKPRPTANVCSPGTRIVYAGAQDTAHCIRSSAATIVGDAWVTADVLVEGGERIVHYIDGLPVIEYGGITYGGGNVDGHDPAQKPDGAPLARGYVSLQSESHPIQFRRVELLPLEDCAERCR